MRNQIWKSSINIKKTRRSYVLFGFAIEALDNREIPECILGCVCMNYVDESMLLTIPLQFFYLKSNPKYLSMRCVWMNFIVFGHLSITMPKCPWLISYEYTYYCQPRYYYRYYYYYDQNTCKLLLCNNPRFSMKINIYEWWWIMTNDTAIHTVLLLIIHILLISDF